MIKVMGQMTFTKGEREALARRANKIVKSGRIELVTPIKSTEPKPDLKNDQQKHSTSLGR